MNRDVMDKTNVIGRKLEAEYHSSIASFSNTGWVPDCTRTIRHPYRIILTIRYGW